MQGVSKLETPNFAGNNWAMSPQEYSPEVKAYLAKLDALAASKGDGYYNPLIVQGEMNNGDVSMPAYATDEYLRQFINQDPESNLGYAYAPTGKWGSTGLVSAGPGTKIVLRDDKTGETVYSGTGIEGAQEAQRRVDAMGGKAPWSIYEAPEGTDNYYQWAQNEPQQGVVGGVADVIAQTFPSVLTGGLAAFANDRPVLKGAATGGIRAASMMLPGLGEVLTPVQMAAASAGLSGAGSLVNGGDLKSSLIKAGLAGAGSYAGSQFGKLFAGGSPNFNGVTDFSGATDFSHLGDGLNVDFGSLGDLSGGFNTDFLSGGAGTDTFSQDPANVTIRANKPNLSVNPVSGVTPALTNFTTTNDPTEIVVNKPKPKMNDLDRALLAVGGAGFLGATAAATAGGGGAGTSAATEAAGAPQVTNPPIDAPPTTTPVPMTPLAGETTAQMLARYANYARLASLGVGVLGGLFGSKGGSAAGKVPAGFGNIDLSAFHGALPPPSPNMVRTPRQLPDQDWNKQGFRPAQLNYNYSNRGPGYVPPPPGQEDPRFPSTGKGYAYGGGARAPNVSLAVRGPGTDRSDSIPSMLSDGEYVIDAPTVRKIGRGNTERGFSKLDDLRVQIHRGRPHRALKSLGAR